jgi:hypothetical protein
MIGTGSPSGNPWKTPAEAQQHVDNLATAICEFNPDMVHMQEVYDCNMLDTLIVSLEGRGCFGYLPYLVKGTDTATQQNTAFITRVDPTSDVQRTENRHIYPLAGNKCNYTGTSGTYGCSKHYFVDFNISGVPFTMVNYHFLAYPDDKTRCAQREAQALVMRDVISSALSSGNQVLVYGDMNDYSDDIPDIEGNVPISRVLSIIRQGLSTKGPPKIADQANLIEAAQNIPDQNTRYSCAWTDSGKPRLSVIDHILASPVVFDSMKPGSTAYLNQLYPRETTSDHWYFKFLCIIYHLLVCYCRCCTLR